MLCSHQMWNIVFLALYYSIWWISWFYFRGWQKHCVTGQREFSCLWTCQSRRVNLCGRQNCRICVAHHVFASFCFFALICMQFTLYAIKENSDWIRFSAFFESGTSVQRGDLTIQRHVQTSAKYEEIHRKISDCMCKYLKSSNEWCEHWGAVSCVCVGVLLVNIQDICSVAVRKHYIKQFKILLLVHLRSNTKREY